VSTRREYPERPVVGVGGVVFDARGHIALIRRRFEPLAGRWSLPGGMVELGEGLKDAVAREVFEETGLHVAVGSLVEVFDRITPGDSGRPRYHFVLVDYLCRVLGGEAQAGSDVSEVALVDPTDLGPYELTDKARSVIARGLVLGQEVTASVS